MSNKAIGQYFSGPLVADLLVSTADISDPTNIKAIDPMVGKADMLNALLRAGAMPGNLFGVDIDSESIASAKTDVPQESLITADAFSDEATRLYQEHEWDLVITNPPYVRYQSLADLYGREAVDVIRKGLEDTISSLSDYGSKQLYLECVRSYSGLADMAVPCWILCAYLVKPGGKLAMVLPDSWLKREYAAVIHKILEADFIVESIIEDESRVWFQDAQIKTSLLVATKRMPDEADDVKSRIRRIGITSKTATSESLVGALSYGGLYGRKAFEALCHGNDDYRGAAAWARSETFASSAGQGASLFRDGYETATLSEWGVSVGQGLRSGANGFFYFEISNDGLTTNEIWTRSGCEPLDPKKLPLMPALRYQEEIGDSCFIDLCKPRHMLLVVSRPLEIGNPDIPDVLSSSLVHYVKYCENNAVIQGGRKVTIPSLSAVRTNGPMSKTPGCSRYWYMLPELRERHLPDLVIPRINGGPARCCLLPEGRRVVVDANFSSLWTNSGNRDDAYIALALLNSTLIKLELENCCNVLGGGALKCEAVSLRKLRLPYPTAELRGELLQLGKLLGHENTTSCKAKILDDIDGAIAREVAATGNVQTLVQRWKQELDIRVTMRSK